MIIYALKDFGIVRKGDMREVSEDVGKILIGKGLASEEKEPKEQPKTRRGKK